MECCSFCDEFTNPISHINAEWERLFAQKSRIIRDMDQWVLIPTLGCFCEGYVLLVNRKHVLSLSRLAADDLAQCRRHIDDLARDLSAVYQKPCVAFEHGIADGSYRGACCVDHVHVHILPYRRNAALWEHISARYRPQFWRLESVEGIGRVITDNELKSYLLFMDITGDWYIINATRDIFPSQFFRQLLYKELFDRNDFGWDWRISPHYANMKRTYDTLAEFYGCAHEVSRDGLKIVMNSSTNQ